MSKRRAAKKKTKKAPAKKAPAKKAPAKKVPAKKKAAPSSPRSGGEEVVDMLTDLTGKSPTNVDDVMTELRQITKKLRRTSSMVCAEDEFRRMVEHLKTMCPIPKRCKVSVKRCDPEEMTEEYGYVTKSRDTFEVWIANNLTEYETQHILLHEWAHVIAWRPYHPLQGDHGGDWGVWYATIWRKFHGVE